MYYRLIYVLILIVIFDYKADSVDWDYGKHGPNVWSDTYSACGGQKQSPINIQTKCTSLKSFEPFYFSSDHNDSLDFTLTNNGHTIVAQTDDSIPLITGGNLDGIFYFNSFHLHWGPNYNTGSEHQVNGDKAAGESHFIYYNNETNHYAVLSFLMESQNTTNDGAKFVNTNVRTADQWRKYFDSAQELSQKNATTTINLVLSLLMEDNRNDFWRYDGSLSTPPCTENVIWTVFRQRIFISDYQFETFRDDLFFQSYRGPQPLYKRTVYRSFPEENVSPIPDQNCCINKSSKPESLFIFNDFRFILLAFLYFFVRFY